MRIDLLASDRFTATNVPLRDLIVFACDVQGLRLVGGPDWIRSERFDIVAKAELAREDRKFGPEITASRLDCENQAKAGRGGPRPSSAPAQPTCGMMISPGQMLVGGTPMSQFATILSNVVQRVVIDRTQLPGTFDFHLSWTPDRIPQGPPPPGAPVLPPVDPNGASLFAALQEQLGLKLESTRAPLDVLVIDRVERPTPINRPSSTLL
jgi:hypothetical protein